MSMPKYAVLQKVRNGKKTYGVTPRIPGGFATPETLIKIAKVSEKYNGTLKITSGQRIAILGLEADDVEKVWEELDMDPGVKSAYSVKNIEMCPAAFCKRTKQNSLKLGMKLEKRFYGADAPNRTKIGVAGCMNSCAGANSKDIGVLANAEGYVIVAGGSAGYTPRLPDEIARDLSEEDAFLMVEAVFEYYKDSAEIGEKLGHYIDRITIEVFKKAVYEYFENYKTNQKDKQEE